MNWLRRLPHPRHLLSTASNWTVLVAIAIVSVAISSATSHFCLRFLKIKSTWGGSAHYGPKDIKPRSALQCSSVAYSAIDWNQVATLVNGSIETIGAPGSTPSEWEIFNNRLTDVDRTFIVVSAVDLNEYAVCDFRAEIVPLAQTIRDLRDAHSDGQIVRTLLTQYPESLARELFPTIGRSDGVMVGVRTKLQNLVGRSSRVDQGATPIFDPANKSEVKERITDWSEGRMQRQLALMRASASKFSFEGPKKLALLRLLQKTTRRGEVILTVLPVSPMVEEQFVSPKVAQEFDYALADIQRRFPAVRIVRIDALRTLGDNALYSDLVHMNMYGQAIATRAFLDLLPKSSAPH